ncbi:MAG: DEAD/DEAH box helicase [Leptonema sp. (in: bacteria)]
MNLRQILEFIQKDDNFAKKIKHLIRIPKQEEKLVDFPKVLDERIVLTLQSMQINKLYLHQLLAFEYVNQGKNVLLTTGTASGKTLAYLLPILNNKLKKENIKALFLYPTKALARDQEIWMNNFCKTLNLKIKIGSFDGDTHYSKRAEIINSGDFILSNPDMLHASILPRHINWNNFFKNLSFIVIDELHIYKGIFGSHLANVLRRLYRICNHYGSNPQIISASATIGNPKEFVEKLTEREFEIIDQDYSKKGEKIFLLYNPRYDSLDDYTKKNRKQNSLPPLFSDTIELAKIFLENHISTIVFCRSRKEVELFTSYLTKNSKYKNLVKSYRSGLLPEERRKIERELREKQILTVVSTNALELGIDIGSLEVSISVGYPGSINSFIQQSGRAGRRTEISLSVLIASTKKMDQYIIKKPEFIFKNNPESVRINPNNLWIVADHLKCSIAEKYFLETDKFGNFPNPNKILEDFLKNGLVTKKGDTYYWSGTNVHNNISLRMGPKRNFVIVDVDKPEKENIIGEMDYYSAPLFLHPHAIYLHQTETYFVEELLWEEQIAKVRKIKVDYYTEAEENKTFRPLYEEKLLERKEIQAYKGELTLISQPTVFKKIKLDTHENLGWGEINLPEIEMRTQGVWFLFEPNFFEEIDLKILLDSLNYGLSIVAMVLSYSESNDLQFYPLIRDPFYKNKVSLYIYDNVPGGLEISYFIYNNFKLILEETINHISNCECKKGCPNCIGLSFLEDKKSDYKSLTIKYLEKLLSIFKNS